MHTLWCVLHQASISVPVAGTLTEEKHIPNDMLSDITQTRKELSVQFYLQQLVDEKWNNDNFFSSRFKMEWEESIALRCFLGEEAIYPSILEDLKEGRLTFVPQEDDFYSFPFFEHNYPNFSQITARVLSDDYARVSYSCKHFSETMKLARKVRKLDKDFYLQQRTEFNRETYQFLTSVAMLDLDSESSFTTAQFKQFAEQVEIDEAVDFQICEAVSYLCCFEGVDEQEIPDLQEYQVYPLGPEGSYWKQLKNSAIRQLKSKGAKQTVPEESIEDILDGTTFNGLGGLAAEGEVGEYTDVKLGEEHRPEGAVLEGMDRPDWGTSEETEAWAWLKE